MRLGDDRQVCHCLLQRLALARRAIIGIYFPPIPWPMTLTKETSVPFTQRRVDKNKSIVMRWMAIALVQRFNGDPKITRGSNFEFRSPLCGSRGETWDGCCLAKGGKTAPRVSWARQISHKLFLQAHFNFMCLQLLTNWVTRKIVLVLFQHFLLYSKRPHGTSICSGEDASSRSINLTSLISAAVDFPSGRWNHRASNVSTWET